MPATEPSFLEGFIQSQDRIQAPLGPGFEEFGQPSRQEQAIIFFQSLGLVDHKTRAFRKQYREFGDEAFELDDLLEPEPLRSVSPRPIGDSLASSKTSSDEFFSAEDCS